jgi:hypothetical protein
LSAEIHIFGLRFEDHTNRYIKWGWDFIQQIRKRFIDEYSRFYLYKNLSSSKFEMNSTENPEIRLMVHLKKLLSDYISKLKVRSDSKLESVISKIFFKIATENGYNDYNKRAFSNSVRRFGHLNNNLLEKYEFLIRFSEVFPIQIKEELIKEFYIYRESRSLLEIKKIRPIHLMEYELLKKVQEFYFKEFKKYISLNELSLDITNKKKVFTDHFKREEPHKFHQFVIFQIEKWCEKTFKNKINLNKILDRINIWRNKNRDNSIYASQETLLDDIAYKIITTYYKKKGKLINLFQLDKMIRKRFGDEIDKRFFGHRTANWWKKKNNKASEEYLKMIKIFVEDLFSPDYPKECKIILEKIGKYLEKPRSNDLLKSHNKEFLNSNSFIIQLKTLMDITKGLDPFLCEFIKGEIILKKAFKSITRQHLDDDPSYNYIFYFHPGKRRYYRIKLAPIYWNPSHRSLHDSSGLNEMANDVVEARMKHLYELLQMDYNLELSREEYLNIFKQMFKKRKAFIFHYGKEVHIWKEFENGKVFSLKDSIIEEFVDRWIYSKKNSEGRWYRKYGYEQFYIKYLKIGKKIIKYAHIGKPTPWYMWFLTDYIRKEIFPYHYPK